jgi:hypothetical protein
MKKNLLKTAIVILTSVVLALSLSAPAAAAGNRSRGAGGTETVTTAPLTAAEAGYLTLMREEEKLARDVYEELYAEWQLPVFDRIAASEQAHMDAIKKLLDKYGIADPAMAPGVFSEASGLQPLYDQLMAQGLASETGAYEVGVAIEEVDIADLKEAIAATTHADILRVYNNLLSGSLRHLAAFSAHLE